MDDMGLPEDNPVKETAAAVKDIKRMIEEKSEHTDHKESHKKALDDLVNVNSLFTIAVFVGLSFASPTQLHGLDSRPGCDANPGVGKRLILFEVVSFSCFLFSSLVAKALKVYLHVFSDDKKRSTKEMIKNFMQVVFKGEELDKKVITNSVNVLDTEKRTIKAGRARLFSLSVASSILGVVFLTLSMANVVQIKLGRLSCGEVHSIAAVGCLSVVVLLALLIYLPSMMHAVVYCAAY